MGVLKVLDCTLRDGGYCNEWRFGNRNTKTIAASLVEAGIDIVELGFLTNRVSYDPDVTKYNDFAQMAAMIPEDRAGKLFVCMVNYGEYRLEDMPNCDGTSVDGIRVAFHKRDRYQALEFCRGIQEKGYKVFIQAMVSLNYTDEEFLELIRLSSDFMPYAFYIVDSFGVMKRRDLMRLFYNVEHNLAHGIAIGYHAHNNMQLAYSNAQALVEIRTNRDRIIDSSVFGMGRGAGNLNTELFVEYLNDNLDASYRLRPLLGIIDRFLSRFYQMAPWGYSLPNYLSAKHNAHPNYASWLDSKKTLTVEDMDSIFEMMEPEKRASYDKAYIEALYLRYQATGQVQEQHLQELRSRIDGNRVLIIAPGPSSVEEADKIAACAAEADVVTIAINFDYQLLDTDFIFLSNLRRFRELSPEKYGKCIVTSNIPSMGVYLQTSYQELLNNIESVRDNAGMMLIRLLMNMGAREILIAGMDGYDTDPARNYADQSMAFYTRRAQMEAMNIGLSTVLKQYSTEIALRFVTKPRFVGVEA